MEYNTQRPHLPLKEYGRNIHIMVQNLLQVADVESRTRQAHQLIEIMRQFVQPGAAAKDNQDLTHKLWDDLYIMSDFKLEVNGPFEKPSPAVLQKKPEPLAYPHKNIIFRHYGKNLETLAETIAKEEDETKRKHATQYLAKVMKTFYNAYNKENIEDEVIVEQLSKISNGKLQLSLEEVKASNLLDVAIIKDKKNNQSAFANERRGQNKKNNRKRKK